MQTWGITLYLFTRYFCKQFLPKKDGTQLGLETHISVFKSLMEKEAMWRRAGNTSSPCMVFLWPCWVSGDPKIRHLRLFPHEETAGFVDFSVGYLDKAASKRLRLAASEMPTAVWIGVISICSFNHRVCPLFSQLKLGISVCQLSVIQ